jgi:nitrite reductase (NO-forming)
MNDGLRVSEPVGESTAPGLSLIGILAGAVFAWVVFLGALAVLAAAIYVFTDREVEVLAERTVSVELSEFDITPDLIEVAPGTDLTFLINNAGDIQHDLVISEDTRTERLNPGESAVLNAGVSSESYPIWCSIKGHRELGMEARVELGSPIG